MDARSQTSAPSGLGSVRTRAGAVDRRYLILSAVVVVALMIQTLNQQWSSDMWLHVSVVRELRTNLFDPGNPLVLGNETHPYYSPYTVAVAGLAKVGGLSAITALSVAGLANLLLFLTAFYLAVSALTGRPRAAFWALLFTLLLWGIVPWRWSGYLNANSIGFGLPYPSMFATGMTLLGFAAMVRLCRRPDLGTALGLSICIAVVALTHPITSFLLALGLLAIAAGRGGVASVRTALVLGGAALLAAFLVLVWPYYSFVDLLQQSGRYDGSHFALYQAVPQRAFLGLASLVFLWPVLRRHRCHPLLLMAVGATGAFLVGYVSDTQTLGRMLPLLLFAGHVSAAWWVTDRLDAVGDPGPRGLRAPRNRPVAIGLGVALTVGALGVSPAYARMVPRGALPPSLRDSDQLESMTHRFDFLEPIDQYDVVLVDDEVGAMVAPALSGKLVVPGYPTPFIEDLEQRSRDQRVMLADENPAVTRRLLTRYSVDFILLSNDDDRRQGLAGYGNVIHVGSDYTLIRLPGG